MANLNIIANINPSVMKTLAGGIIPEEALDYIDRVLADSGVIDDNDTLYDIVRFYRDNNLLTDTKLLAAPFLGSKLRTSGIYKYLSKLYSVELPANDLAQTTELNQPYQSGNIAPNEVLSMQNPNGDARFMTHPAISFAANQAWSVSVISRYNGSLATGAVLLGNSLTDTAIWVDATVGGITQSVLFRNALNQDTATLYDTKILNGKNFLLTFVADGSGGLKLYVNGTYITGVSISTAANFVRIFGVSSYAYMYGDAYFYRIQSGAMTATQVLAEYNKLRTYIPEIETVQIGSKYITSSNFQAVATPAGNVIQEMQAASAVEKITGGNFESGLIGTLNAGDSISTYSINTTAPISGIQDARLQVTSVSSVTYRPTLVFLTSRVVGKWRKLSFKYKVNSGTCKIDQIYKGGSPLLLNITLTGSGTFTQYFKVDGTTNLNINFDGRNLFDLQIDDISEQELNWSNAIEIYDAVYADTSGTTAQKEYAALKEAAMWCSYDNSTANQAIYGKFYNDYAIQLLKTDMAAQNFGYHIPTEAEKAEILATYTDANDLKKEGTNYWDNALGTNASGLTLLGTGCRMPDGSFASIKKVGGFATSDGNVSKQLGLPIRLVKD